MPVSAKTYERVALEDREGLWELWCGQLRRKPPMTFEHDNVIDILDYGLKEQLDAKEYAVRVHPVRLRAPSGSYYIPDLCIIPRGAVQQMFFERGRELSVFDSPMPLVVEVWSPSTGRKDRNTKLAEYRSRGDLEIWLIHPRQRTLRAWRRQPDGSYLESEQKSGAAELAALPGVRIVVEQLFDPL